MPTNSKDNSKFFHVEITSVSSWYWQLKSPIHFEVTRGHSIYTVFYRPLGMEVRDRNEVQATNVLKKLIIDYYMSLVQKQNLSPQEKKDLAHLNTFIEKRTFQFDNNSKLALIVASAVIIISFATAIRLSTSSRRLYTQATQKVEQMSSLIDYYKVENYLYSKYPYLKRKSAIIHDMLQWVYTSAQLYNIDPYLLLAQGCWESGGFEKDNENTIGGAGEIGWWQILPSTGECFSYTRTDLKDLRKNVNFGAYYLRCCMDNADNNEQEALARYNGGRAYKIQQCQDYAKTIIGIRSDMIKFVQNQ